MDGYSSVLDMIYDEIAALSSNLAFIGTAYDLAMERQFYPPGIVKVDLEDISSRLETVLNDTQDVLDACFSILRMKAVEKSIQGIVRRTVGNSTATPVNIKAMHTWKEAVRRVEQREHITAEMAEFILERVSDWASDNGWTVRYPLHATYNEDIDDEDSNTEESHEEGSDEEKDEEDEEFFDALEVLTD